MDELVEQRVEIAEKVIEELNQKWIIATQGNYFDFVGEVNLDKVTSKTKLQTVFADKACEGCAIGALFIAAVDLYNGLKAYEAGVSRLSGGIGLNLMLRHLARWFPESQLRLMEIAFEGTSDNDSYARTTNEERDRAYRFHTALAKRKSRAKTILLTIMRNVVKNDGEFKP